MTTASPRALRRQYAARRRAQQPEDIDAASAAIAAHCIAALQGNATGHGPWRVASYIAMPSEVQTTSLNAALAGVGAQVHAPVVRGQTMHFAPLRPPLRRASTGNWQPPLQACCMPKHLDVVLLPLLAFDLAGNRLGMGGGYYDRCFAAYRNRGLKRPLRVGLAFDWQRADSLPAQPWDVPLHAVVTETGWIDLPAAETD